MGATNTAAAVEADGSNLARKAGQFPKRCTMCVTVYLTEQAWGELPAARGGLYAHGAEWRNHSCGGTLVVQLAE